MRDPKAEVASCPECGCLIWVNVSTKTGATGPFDFHADSLPLLLRAVGLDPVIRQGFGVGNGCAHVCPPTLGTTSIEIADA